MHRVSNPSTNSQNEIDRQMPYSLSHADHWKGEWRSLPVFERKKGVPEIRVLAKNRKPLAECLDGNGIVYHPSIHPPGSPVSISPTPQALPLSGKSRCNGDRIRVGRLPPPAILPRDTTTVTPPPPRPSSRLLPRPLPIPSRFLIITCET